jgi:heme/copper-type cytochrome/quinol oxidase subunit 2
MSSAAFWLVIVAISFAEGAIIVAALRMHVDSSPSRGVLGARPFEIFWTLLPLALVALMVILSYDAHQAERSDSSETHSIETGV